MGPASRSSPRSPCSSLWRSDDLRLPEPGPDRFKGLCPGVSSASRSRCRAEVTACVCTTCRTPDTDTDPAALHAYRDPMTRRSPYLRRLRRKWDSPDRLNSIRRLLEQRSDQAWALTAKFLRRLPWRRQPVSGEPISAGVAFGILTVNFSTTRYLKLMLLTLAEQDAPQLIRRIVIADNGSQDGGAPFLRELSSRIPQISLVEHRHFLNHARGLRGAAARLDRNERSLPACDQSNVLLFCDSDIVFRSPDALRELATAVATDGAALVGELRKFHEYPDIQASFFAVRRDVYDSVRIAPLVNHGSPAYWLQRSIWQADLPVVDFPSNQGGFVLHRGRTAVAAARRFRPRHSYATAEHAQPHFMNVVDGAESWEWIESRFAHLLEPSAESQLVELLRHRFRGSAHDEADTAAPRPTSVGSVVDAPDPNSLLEEPSEGYGAAPLDPAQRLMWAPGSLKRTSLDGVALLAGPGEPVTLTGTSLATWSLFEAPTSTYEAVAAIVDVFGTPEDVALRQMIPFLQSLLAAGLLQLEPSPAPEVASDG